MLIFERKKKEKRARGSLHESIYSAGSSQQGLGDWRDERSKDLLMEALRLRHRREHVSLCHSTSHHATDREIGMRCDRNFAQMVIRLLRFI